MVLALGTSSNVAGQITNTVAGGNLTLAANASLAFQTGGVIDVDAMSIGTGCIVDLNGVQNAYIRVNGNQKATFDALIAGGQVVSTGGGPTKASYDSGTDHTNIIWVTPRGTLIMFE